MRGVVTGTLPQEVGNWSEKGKERASEVVEIKASTPATVTPLGPGVGGRQQVND